MTTYKIKNTQTGEMLSLNLKQILEEINRDRSAKWTNYNKTDWREGLKTFTDYTLISVVKTIVIHSPLSNPISIMRVDMRGNKL